MPTSASDSTRDSPRAALAPCTVCTMYKFVKLCEYHRLQVPLLATMRASHVVGTILLAAEGINGTIAGAHTEVATVMAWLGQQPGLAGLTAQYATALQLPFLRAKVKLRREIVTIGVAELRPLTAAQTGTYVAPAAWNAMVDDPAVLVIDARNEYEIAVGAFANAVNPKTRNFREFPAYARHLDPAKHKKIAMYCTGGIRCEKSTALLKQAGFDEVYQLEGGILNYLATIPPEHSRWGGECFVFDARVSVDHNLQPGQYDQCHACRMPISPADQVHPHYVAGSSCRHCYPTRTAADRRRYAEREKQVRLAARRGQVHIGRRILK